MDFEEYMREIDLMIKQNNTEYDMYSVIAAIMREGDNIKKLSLREMTGRRKGTNKGRVFYGLASFPDFAILDYEFTNSENWEDDIDKVYGCIEIKEAGYHLLSLDDIKKVVCLNNIDNNKKIEQLLGEIIWYEKVLYTNGLEWKLFTYKGSKDGAKKYLKRKFEQEKAVRDKWYENEEIDIFSAINNITETTLIKINQEKRTSESDWEMFKDKLHSIKWIVSM